MDLPNRWLTRLEALEGQGRLRRLQLPAGVDFSSNDYLGYAKLLSSSPSESLSRSGAASRLLRGHHEIWDRVEQALARWHDAEAALMMTSGYVANMGLLSAIIEPGDHVLSDALNHASIIDGLKLTGAMRHIYRHGCVEEVDEILRRVARERAPNAATYIVTESLFSMEGDTPPLQELCRLAEKHKAHLIVDDAHAAGCLGPAGAGLVNAFGLRSRVLATVQTGGKALGVAGAYICCSATLKRYLINHCRQFIFTTALPPIVGVWWLEAIQRVQADDACRRRLGENTRLFRDELTKRGVDALGEQFIVPIVLGDDVKAVKAARKLQEAGFDVRSIRPPTVPEGTSRLRVSIHADHDAETLCRAAAAIAEVGARS